MPKMNLSHFEAAFLFSLFASVVMGVVTKRTDRDRLHYGIYTFGCFLLALFALGWLMYFGHGEMVLLECRQATQTDLLSHLPLSAGGGRKGGIARALGHHDV